MTLEEFTEMYYKHEQKLNKRYRGIGLLYISGMPKSDIAKLEKVTPQRIFTVIKTIEGKFIKWNQN